MTDLGLPFYVRTRETRKLDALECDNCEDIWFPPDADYCPTCGRDYGKLHKLDLLNSHLGWKIASFHLNRKSDQYEEWTGMKAFGRVYAEENKKINIPTQFTDIKTPTKIYKNIPDRNSYLEIDGILDVKVEPTIRILDQSGDLNYYGVKFSPAVSEKRQKPFTKELIDFEKPGIASLGVAIPKLRTSADKLAEAYDMSTAYIERGLKVKEVSVPNWDQNSDTLGLDSVYDALSKLPPEIIPTIGAVFVGSESPAHDVKNLGTQITSFFNLKEEQMIALGSEFACVPQWMALPQAYSLIETGRCDTALLVGTDVSQGRPGDALDLDTGAMASCMIISRYNHILKPVTEKAKTLVRDHADFLRRGEYPIHGGAFTGEPAYFAAQINTCTREMKDAGLEPEDINSFIAHYPNGNFPRKLGERLGFKPQQYEDILYAGDHLGNGYTASVGVSLAYAVNDAHLKQGEEVLVSAYGSTLGAVAQTFRGTELLPKYQESCIPVKTRIDTKRDVSMYRRALNKGMVKLK